MKVVVKTRDEFIMHSRDMIKPVMTFNTDEIGRFWFSVEDARDPSKTFEVVGLMKNPQNKKRGFSERLKAYKREVISWSKSL